MVIEAQRDAASVVARQVLTECLLENYDHSPILASMGSLAPYMQETARAGLSIRQFIHEGIGQLWADSLIDPSRHASWYQSVKERHDLAATALGHSILGMSRRVPHTVVEPELRAGGTNGW
jgi:hypothetical protein